MFVGGTRWHCFEAQQKVWWTMNYSESDVKQELKNCKRVLRFVTDKDGNRYWVIGVPSTGLLVRKIVDGSLKPVRTMSCNDIASIEPTEDRTEDRTECVELDGMDLKKMIANITEDIRAYQMVHGPHIVLNPNHEAYRLCHTKLKLQHALQQIER